MIELHTLKFVEDPLRREPRNIGLFAVATPSAGGPARVATRFVGEREHGKLDGRALHHIPVDVLRGWIDYFTWKLTEHDRDTLRRLAQKRDGSFYLDHVATLMEETDLHEALNRMFPTVVGDRPAVEPKERIDQRVDELLTAAGIRPQRDIHFTGQIDGGEALPAAFGYGFQNGQLHLMDPVPTPRQSTAARRNANDFAWRARLAVSADLARSFVSFVDLSDVPRSFLDDELLVLWKVSHVVDLAEWDAAVNALEEIATHDVKTRRQGP